MVSFRNWSGRHESRPAELHFVRSEEDALAVAVNAAENRLTVRATGSGHSHSPLLQTGGVIADTSGLAGVIDVDPDTRKAWVWAGSKIYALGRPLHEAGLALINQGDIDRQAIAGACATGTHGTGKHLNNLSAAVTGIRIALSTGEYVDCNARENPDIWQAGRLNLGALGIVTRLELQLRDAYRLKESGFETDYETLSGQIDERVDRHERFEFFWYPKTDRATVKMMEETGEPAEYPVADEGSRVAWSYEVLPSHRPHLHTEMEYSIPAEYGTECFSEIRSLIRNRFRDVAWPVEYRTVAADDVWLSMAYGRPTVTISVHQDIRQDETAYYQACEAIFRGYGGRPHWGKVHYLEGRELSGIHPCWEKWWAVRDACDPGGTFLNSYLRSVRPDP